MFQWHFNLIRKHGLPTAAVKESRRKRAFVILRRSVRVLAAGAHSSSLIPRGWGARKRRRTNGSVDKNSRCSLEASPGGC